MCGIAGIISDRSIDGDDITTMTSALRHRGPDAEGTYVNRSRTVALGHTRLSIIDLRPESNQPFHSASGRYVVVFNGEIYNFRQVRKELSNSYSISFRTQSDTEIIAEAFSIWGDRMVDKLEGMFSIAILDQETCRVYFFRDRVGKKPLFYFKSERLFAFASEIKSLLEHPVVKREVKVNYKIIPVFLHLGYIPEPHSIFTNIFKFPSACRGVIDQKLDLRIEPYWQIENHIDPKRRSPNAATDELHDLLHDSVKKRLIADVPLGAFLSGGTDSSLISAIASKHSIKPLQTFSIGFKESKFDERKYASKVATALRTDHTEYLLSEKEAVGFLDKYINHFDEPFADTSAIPTMLVSQLAKNKVSVALTGDGGDELFQGYGAYMWANRLAQPFAKVIRAPLRIAMVASGKNRALRVSHMLEAVANDQIRSHIFSQEQYLFSQREVQKDLLLNSDDFTPFLFNDLTIAERKLTAGERQAVFDLMFYLKDDLLVKVDRASMYSALECRSPLLDHRVIEFAFSLDHTLKIKGGKSKWILKQILRQYLPDDLVDRKKWGFSIPLSQWLKADLRYLFDSFLNKEIIEDIGLFHVTYINQLKKDFFAGKEYLYHRLWALILTHKWLKENT
jgi:asparagine synthase (glutamine-hydrolysing)